MENMYFAELIFYGFFFQVLEDGFALKNDGT
jgi:hypothetical protein